MLSTSPRQIAAESTERIFDLLADPVLQPR
jgi:hypothetical protein